MAQSAKVSTSLCISLIDANATKAIVRNRAFRQSPFSKFTRLTSSSFATGSPLLAWRISSQRKPEYKATSISIRCGQSAKENNSLDVWLGRLAMVGFTVAITVEISTGKGLLENFGLTTPLPTVALALTALVGALMVIFIFQSASKD